MSFYRYVTSILLLLNVCQYLNFPCRSHVDLANICSGQNYNVRLLTFLTISKCCIFNLINSYIKLYQVWSSITDFFILHSNWWSIINTVKFDIIIFLSSLILIYYTSYSFKTCHFLKLRHFLSPSKYLGAVESAKKFKCIPEQAMDCK